MAKSRIRMWPANMFAKSRRASVTGRTIRFDMNSSGTSRARIGPVMPPGTHCSLR